MEGLKEKSNPEMENKESSMCSNWENAHVILRRMRGRRRGGGGGGDKEDGEWERKEKKVAVTVSAYIQGNSSTDT